MTPFVPANQLYDVDSRTPIAHPAIQATDDDIRCALEAFDGREVRTDGGCSSSGNDQSDKKEVRFNDHHIGEDKNRSTNRQSQNRSNYKKEQLNCVLPIVHSGSGRYLIGDEIQSTGQLNRSLHTDTDRKDGGSP